MNNNRKRLPPFHGGRTTGNAPCTFILRPSFLWVVVALTLLTGGERTTSQVHAQTSIACDLCQSPLAEIGFVPPENEQKLVQLTLFGAQPCGGLYEAAKNPTGLFTSINTCQSVRNEFAPVCCTGGTSGPVEDVGGSTATPPTASPTLSPVIVDMVGSVPTPTTNSPTDVSVVTAIPSDTPSMVPSIAPTDGNLRGSTLSPTVSPPTTQAATAGPSPPSTPQPTIAPPTTLAPVPLLIPFCNICSNGGTVTNPSGFLDVRGLSCGDADVLGRNGRLTAMECFQAQTRDNPCQCTVASAVGSGTGTNSTTQMMEPTPAPRPSPSSPTIAPVTAAPVTPPSAAPVSPTGTPGTTSGTATTGGSFPPGTDPNTNGSFGSWSGNAVAACKLLIPGGFPGGGVTDIGCEGYYNLACLFPGPDSMTQFQCVCPRSPAVFICREP